MLLFKDDNDACKQAGLSAYKIIGNNKSKLGSCDPRVCASLVKMSLFPV